MRVERIELDGFRCYDTAAASFADGITAVVGAERGRQDEPARGRPPGAVRLLAAHHGRVALRPRGRAVPARRGRRRTTPRAGTSVSVALAPGEPRRIRLDGRRAALARSARRPVRVPRLPARAARRRAARAGGAPRLPRSRGRAHRAGACGHGGRVRPCARAAQRAPAPDPGRCGRGRGPRSVGRAARDARRGADRGPGPARAHVSRRRSRRTWRRSAASRVRRSRYRPRVARRSAGRAPSRSAAPVTSRAPPPPPDRTSTTSSCTSTPASCARSAPRASSARRCWRCCWPRRRSSPSCAASRRCSCSTTCSPSSTSTGARGCSGPSRGIGQAIVTTTEAAHLPEPRRPRADGRRRLDRRGRLTRRLAAGGRSAACAASAICSERCSRPRPVRSTCSPVLRVWPAAVGAGIAREAWPARTAADGTLVVHVTSSAVGERADR